MFCKSSGANRSSFDREVNGFLGECSLDTKKGAKKSRQKKSDKRKKKRERETVGKKHDGSVHTCHAFDYLLWINSIAAITVMCC